MVEQLGTPTRMTARPDCPPWSDSGKPTNGSIRNSDLICIAQWVSPTFPVGSFAYSHGLEQAVSDGNPSDPKSLREWIDDCLKHGSGRNDAILLCHARNASDASDLHRIADLAKALCACRERYLETMEQGRAFTQTVNAVWHVDLPTMPYPVALGAASRDLSLADQTVASFFLHAFANSLTSAGVRLVPIGQTAGQRILKSLIPVVERVSVEAAVASLDELGGCSILADMASMRHETMQTRLFRT